MRSGAGAICTVEDAWFVSAAVIVFAPAASGVMVNVCDPASVAVNVYGAGSEAVNVLLNVTVPRQPATTLFSSSNAVTVTLKGDPYMPVAGA
ncbi:MAG: hypothetical protein DMF57_13465 [Acidobacteria bacterium]|nr:MAG: hypothetical protein DMF57_13465 [Acidobacteriota bacterium]